jgi:fumarylacetoacetase
MGSQSWLDIGPESPFSLANIPFGIVSTPLALRRDPPSSLAIMHSIFKLFASNIGFAQLPAISQNIEVFSQPTLNSFAALGQSTHRQVRKYLQEVLSANGPYKAILEQNPELQQKVLVPLKDVKSHLPMNVGDYTDFYAGRNHAYNVSLSRSTADFVVKE